MSRIDITNAWEENTLLLNASGPELVRVSKYDDNLYLVEIYSEVSGKWIAVAEHTDVSKAKLDTANWY